jgi:hypothetical protein
LDGNSKVFDAVPFVAPVVSKLVDVALVALVELVALVVLVSLIFVVVVDACSMAGAEVIDGGVKELSFDVG